MLTPIPTFKMHWGLTMTDLKQVGLLIDTFVACHLQDQMARVQEGGRTMAPSWSLSWDLEELAVSLAHSLARPPPVRSEEA